MIITLKNLKTNLVYTLETEADDSHTPSAWEVKGADRAGVVEITNLISSGSGHYGHAIDPDEETNLDLNTAAHVELKDLYQVVDNDTELEAYNFPEGAMS